MDNVVPLILVSTRDIDFYLFIEHVLQNEKLTSQLAVGKEETRTAVKRLMPEAILLDCRDRTCPAGDICPSVKKNAATKAIPIVALVDPSANWPDIRLSKANIDEIVLRPIIPSKLVDRLMSVLPDARFRKRERVIARYADIEIDMAKHQVRRGGQEVRLSPTEFKLLRYFLERPEEAVTREELYNAAWMDNIHVGPRTVDVHVGRLRKALRMGHADDVIHTVRTVGYSLSIDVADDPLAEE